MSDFAPAAEAATKVIAFLAECQQEVGVSEISRGTGMNKNMVFRILNTLEKEKWVFSEQQKYGLTLLPFKLTSKALSRLPLNTATTPVLYDLHSKTGESTYLGILKDDMVLYIQHLDGVKNVRVAGRIGGEYDLYCSAPGKVLLAYADDAFIEKYLSRELEKRTENTITDKNALLTELNIVRQKGYATDAEEFGNGISCVAAPIFDYRGRVVGCIGNSAFTPQNDSQTIIKNLLPYVLEAAKEITIRMGGSV